MLVLQGIGLSPIFSALAFIQKCIKKKKEIQINQRFNNLISKFTAELSMVFVTRIYSDKEP